MHARPERCIVPLHVVIDGVFFDTFKELVEQHTYSISACCTYHMTAAVPPSTRISRVPFLARCVRLLHLYVVATLYSAPPSCLFVLFMEFPPNHLTQPPITGQTAAQLEEEARAFALRVRDVSKYAWAEFIQAANAGTSFHLGAAALDVATLGDGRGAPTVGATARSSSPGVSPRPSGLTGRGGRITPAERGPPPANPLQATFLNRVCLFDIDDKHKAKLQRWWMATRCWSWGYEKQRRTDESIAKQEREATEAEEEKRAAAAAVAEEEAAAVAAATAAAEEHAAALKHKDHHGPSAAAASGRGRLSAQRSIQQPEGGEADVGRREGRSSARGALGSGATALGRRWQRRHATGATGEKADGESLQQEHRGLRRTHTAPPTAGVGDPTRGGVATLAVEGKGHHSVASVSVGPITGADWTDPSVAAAAAEGGLAADGHEAESTAAPEVESNKVESPQPVDWERDVWSQCRLHRVSTSPLLLPLTSSTLMGFSAKDSTRDDGDPGEEASLIVEANRSPNEISRFSGPYGGGYTEREGRWESGKWETTRGSVGRGTPSGSGAIGAVGDKEALTSPKEWGASSHNSPGVTQFSGSGAEGASARVGRAGSSAACLSSSRDRYRTQSEFEDIEVLRSRSATSSGPGRDSFDSNVELDEKWDPTSSSSTAMQPTRGAAAGDVSRAFGGSGTSDRELDDAGGGELRQTRSVSLAGLGLTRSGWDGEPGGAPLPTLRRQSSAAAHSLREAGATPGSAATSTPRERGTTVGAEDAAVKAEEAERAAALARQFVRAYSSYLVEYLGFKLMGGPTNGVAETQTAATAASAMGSNGTPRTRRLYAGQTTTPPSSHGLGAPGWGEGPTHGGGKAEGRANEYFCSPATRGSGGELLAHALLRLPFELTNTVALVEVSVMVAPRASRAAAVAAAVEPMQASVKFWTVDVMEPSSGWEGDGPIGGSVEGQSPSRSWWASLPTLTSFKWNVDPDNPTFYGDDLPEELPHDMYRVIHKLRFRNSVEDFMVGQVNIV